MSDRLAGMAILAVSLVYLWAAGGYEAGFGDPLGPAAFPRIIGIPAAVISILLIIWPGRDPQWAGGRRLIRQIAALATLIGYALLLEPLGFVPSTFLAVGGLALLMGARLVPALLTAATIAPALYILFDRVMGLPLPLLGPLIT
ncbi:tripartite tricarboxylate transporter TctB family protein [Pseudoruegeria sp. SK021]|uniref:tripartite tricarboxylate transporter TctB family protein n=1 Tax=Pseudoruegeria sp. SK021 TaxID=1933035 RepID=UPI000A222DE4|nr:tripartite tricarboxylate transporter TctB family protein [Pseudoruegeria sp. SK021]OSP53676.1 hypothetical protein BV911_16690 [Pseudoruegeria sp. SK021]